LLPGLGLASGDLQAQALAYPQRPITLLLGTPAGGVPDMVARPLAERLGAALGQPVVVQNRPGAAGALAMSALARSAPDGHTLGITTLAQAVFNSYLFDKLPYDPLKEFQPISPLVTGAFALAAHPAWPGTTLADYIAGAKAQPGKHFIAVPQTGSAPHVVGLFIHQATGVDVQMVAYKSGPDALRAAIAGETTFALEATNTISQQVKSGRLKAIAVTGPLRDALLPQTPTLRESGVPLQAEAWIGLVAPAGTPGPIIERIHREVASVMNAPEVREAMAALGFRTQASSPRAFGDLIVREHAAWGPAIRRAGIKLTP
jgi:tripartite-type tricarboxylate transporter receptor subunit TctC